MQPQDPTQPQPTAGQPEPIIVGAVPQPPQTSDPVGQPMGVPQQQFASSQPIIQPAEQQVTQPMEVPQQPTQPVAPQFAQPQQPQPVVSPAFMQSPQQQPFAPQPMAQSFNAYGQQKSNKKLFAMISGGITALIILIVGGIFAMGALGGVSKADYKKAYDLTRETYSAYNALSTGFYTIRSDDTSSADTKAAQMTDARSKFDSKLSELGKTKAIKRDAALKADYKKVDDKKKTFYDAYDTLTEAYLYIAPEVAKIRNYFPSSDPISQVTSARAKLAGLTLKTETNKTFVASLLAQMDDFEKYAKKYVQNSNLTDSSKYDPNAYTNYSNVDKKITALSDAWQDSLTKTLDDKDINDELNDLGRAVTKKYNDAN